MGDRNPAEDGRDVDEQELLEEARKFLDYVETAEADNRNRAAEMLRFCYRRGSQWPDKIRRERESDNRPCLEINQMPAFINQVCNDERQNRPAIKVRAASSDATKPLAEIRQDLIRHIEYDSSADQVYDNGFRYAVAANTGYWRVLTCYEQEDSFYQKLILSPIKDSLSVYYDPDCNEPDGSDAEKCLVTEEFTKEEFRRKWPDAQEVDWQTTDPILTAWIKPDSIRVADYLHKCYWRDCLYLLPDGSTSWESEEGSRDKHDPMEAMLQLVMPNQPPKKPGYVKKRDVERCEVQWHVINGVQILETHQWLGKYIPVVPCWGDVTYVEGQVIRQALVERAQDMQQMYDFWVTTAAEAAALQPKAPFLVTAEQVAGDEEKWGKANTKPYPYLLYKRYDETGKDLGVPQRSSADVDVSGMLQQAQICQADMRSTIGIQDPLQMVQTQDESGRAILAKERVGNTATFHFVDNLSRAIRYTGRILLDLIPKIYDTQREVQLLREDGSDYKKIINQPTPPDLLGNPRPTQNDMTQGDYDVVVDAGPSYASKRVEFVNSAMELAQSNPTLWQVAGDLMVANMDWPNSEAIADRLKVTLPPQIQALEASKSEDPHVVALGQSLKMLQQQSQQQMQAMGQELQKINTENLTLKGQLAKAGVDTQSARMQLMAKEHEIMQKDRETQADYQEQVMETRDVEMRTELDREKAASEDRERQARLVLDNRELDLKAFETLANIVEKLGPQAGAEGAEVAEKELPAAVSAIEGQSQPNQAEMFAPIAEKMGSAVEGLAKSHSDLASHLMATHQGLQSHLGQIHGVLSQLGQGSVEMQNAVKDLAARKPAAEAPKKPRRMRAMKDKDGSYIGEFIDDEEEK